MQKIEYFNVIDKSGWGDGAWQAEPDKRQWPDEKTGLPCLMVRGTSGSWCGYVGVPPGHPLHGQSYDEPDVEVHGGLTFAGPCADTRDEAHAICHKPDPGEPDDVYWFGFDCAHAFDLMPGMRAMLRQWRIAGREVPEDEYRDVAYVEAECARLAKQLSAL